MQGLRGLASAISTLLVALALVANARMAATSLRRVSQADGWVRHTYEVREALHDLLASLQDAETSERGFIITGDASYLDPYSEGRAVALGRLERLDDLTRENPVQQRRIDAMRPIVARKLNVLERAIALRRSGPEGLEGARAIVLSGEGKRLMDELRDKVAEMEGTEDALLAERTRASAAAGRNAMLTNVVGLAGGLVLLAVAFGVWRSRVRERERAAVLLREEKETLRTTLTSIGDGVVVTDREGRITMMNATARSVLGWGDDAIGMPLEEVFVIVNEHTRATVESPVRRVLRDGNVAGLANHTLLVRRDGSETPIDDSGAPIRDARGQIVGVVLVFRDIRERRDTERELQRRAELLEEQDKHKDQFLAALSHELRNPLAPVRNAVGVLQRANPASEEASRARAVIDRQVAHLARLVDDLLDVSRIAQGKLRLDKRHVDLAEIVRRTVEDHRNLFATKGVRLEFEYGGHLWVEADATRLAQVAENLLHNAAKFTMRGGRVAVALSEEEGRALLRVRDDGVGIEKETLATLFQPFVQGARTLSRTPGGLGLGLALSRNIVELHGGSVQARSDGPGQGTEFIVALPSSRNLASRPLLASVARARRPLRICVIDDNGDAAETLRDLLELEGHVVHVANDGALGIEVASAVQPDVVLCDLALPGLDGFEVARRLRAARSPATLVALTGYVAADDVQRAHDAGFDHHLAKPTELEKLEALLASVAPADDAPAQLQ